MWKNGRFSGRIWPDWGNTAWADMAGLGSIGLLTLHTASKMLSCHMSNLGNTPCCVPYFPSHITKVYVACRFYKEKPMSLDLSNLRVKGPTRAL